MEYQDKYSDLAPIAKGVSFIQVFDLLYKLAMLKCASQPLLSPFNKKIATKFKLPKLVKSGYLEETEGWYSVTGKTLEVLQAEGYNTSFIRKSTGCKGHQREVSSV